MWEENIQEIARDFPNTHKTYTIFAKIDHVYNSSEERHFIDFLNADVPTKDRKERTERRVRKKRLAAELDVNNSELYISSPDIVITPIAIYG